MYNNRVVPAKIITRYLNTHRRFIVFVQALFVCDRHLCELVGCVSSTRSLAMAKGIAEFSLFFGAEAIFFTAFCFNVP